MSWTCQFSQNRRWRWICSNWRPDPCFQCGGQQSAHELALFWFSLPLSKDLWLENDVSLCMNISSLPSQTSIWSGVDIRRYFLLRATFGCDTFVNLEPVIRGRFLLIKQWPVNIGQCVEAGHGLQTPDFYHLFTARRHYEGSILEQRKGHNVNKTFTKNVFPQLELSNELMVCVDWG